MNELSQIPGAIITNNTSGDRFDERRLCQFLSNANPDILIVGLEHINSIVLNSAPNLKFIAKYGVGLDNIECSELEKRGIALGWTGGLNRRSVAEQVICFAIGHLRNISRSIELMKSGKWIKEGGRELSNCKFGIVGLGNIGSDLAKLVNAFGAQVFYYDIQDKRELADQLKIKKASYEEILASCDVISFHVPLNPQSTGMFGAKEIQKCKKNALIINTSRGVVVNFDEVCQAVRNKLLGGFAADVFPVEPFDGSIFKYGEPLYFTPHIGGNSNEAIIALGTSAIDHIKGYLKC